jgi:hypothetical protein
MQGRIPRQELRRSPAAMLDLVDMIEEEERKLGGRLTDYLPAAS